MQYRDVAQPWLNVLVEPSLPLLPLMLLLLQVMMIVIHLTAAWLSFRLVSVLWRLRAPYAGVI